MQIIRPDETDLTSIFEILQECKSALDAQGIKQWDDVYPNIDVVKEDLKNQSIYVAKVNEEIAGVVSFDNNDFEEYKSINWHYIDGEFTVLHRLAVRLNYQGHGIAHRLMEFVHHTCQQQQIHAVRLDVYSGNGRAVDFYKKLGYELRGEVRFPRRALPFYCMEKKI